MDRSRLQRNTQTFQLEIIEAKNLPLTRVQKKPPSAFVKLVAGDFRDATRILPPSRAPSWNETFIIPNVQDSTVLSLRVFHRSLGLWEHCIGEVQIGFLALFIREGNDQQINLQLTHEKHKADGGVLTIRIKEGPLVQAANAALDAAGKAREKILANLSISDTSGRLLDIIPNLGPFIEIADKIATVHPFVNIAWQVTSLIIKIPKGQLERDKNVVDLITTMEDLFSYVISVDSLRLMPVFEETVQQILKQTIECTFFIRAYAKHSFGGRAAIQTFSDAPNKTLEFKDAFIRLKERFTIMSSMHITFVSSRTLDLIEDLTRKAKLNPVDMSTAGRPSCLPETRLGVIKFITDWIVEEEQKPVLWLYGQTGSGKSTISTTIADMSRELRRLGAFIFFDRDVKDRSDPSLVTTTMAYKLASFDAGLGEAVSAAIKSIPDIAESPLHFQFRNLIVQPLLSAESRGPLVIIIDALDECGTAESRKILLSVLTREIGNLPPLARILITSRPEDDIKNTLHTHPSVIAHELDITSAATEGDIERFITNEMAEIRHASGALNLEPDWPGEEKVSALTKRAAGLFIWASTACTFISRCYDPRRNLDLLTGIDVSPVPLNSLDRLYGTALQCAGDWCDDAFRFDCVAILGLVLVARVPLLCESISDILSLSRPTLYTIKGLRSVLRWSESEPIRILHPSFQDFLSDRRRCGTDHWFIALDAHHNDIAFHCIALLERRLKNNICNLTVCEPFDDHILPESLSYASVYWIEHACLGRKTAENLARIYAFLSRHLLHWMEVMSILGMSRRVIRELRRLHEWIKLEDHDRLPQLIYDARRFSQFFADAIEEHPLLIYATAIPFCPVNTTVYDLFHSDGMLRVSGAVESTWPMLELQLRGHDSAVISVAFSRDASRIVSGSDNGTIRVWDVNTGIETLPPLRGHSRRIWSVAFSPDGSIIASGSEDNTIRIWDASTGTETHSPLTGHGSTVYSIAFSQDGSKIVSGSGDKTIRVWDPVTGAEALPPFRGHDDYVRSVAFSRDESRIVSGSEDKTVRVWDVSTQSEALQSLRGHSYYVLSVAFSNDGSKIVSGSTDHTVRVWDANTGAPILPPLKEHQGWVCSVAFSPDDSNIVSGSDDRTICIWDASNGSMTLPLRGHNDYISSVAYSHDGSKIVSGSGDKMIFVWDVTAGFETLPSGQGGEEIKCVAFSHDGSIILAGLASGKIRVWNSTGAKALPTLEGHDDCVYSVAFSHDDSKIVSASADGTVCIWNTIPGAKTPLQGHNDEVNSATFSHDGSRIVSGSNDKTVCVWDAITGTKTLQPLQGHEAWVRSVAFSHDSSKIASGSNDKTIRIWDTTTGAEILSCRGHDDWVFSVAFSNDGSKLVSGSFDGTVRVWDISTGTEILPPLRGHDTRTFIHSVAFSHNDSKIVSSSNDKTIRVWDASNGKEISQHSEGRKIACNFDTSIIEQPQSGLISLDENGWVTDIATGSRARLPTGLTFSRFDAHGSKLAAWTESNELLLIEFPPLF